MINRQKRRTPRCGARREPFLECYEEDRKGGLDREGMVIEFERKCTGGRKSEEEGDGDVDPGVDAGSSVY